MKKIISVFALSIILISAKAQQKSGSTIAEDKQVTNNIVTVMPAETTAIVSANASANVNTSKSLKLMPNARTNDIQIIFKEEKATEAIVTVTDENGKTVLEKKTNLSAGANTINVDNFHTLNEGTYTIQLACNNEMHSSKFIVWK